MSRTNDIVAMERRRFLRAALAGGALAALGGGVLIPRLSARAAPTAPVPASGRRAAGMFRRRRPRSRRPATCANWC